LAYLNARSEEADLWNNPAEAQKLMRERTLLDANITGIQAIERDLSDNIEMIELGVADNDATLVSDAENAIKTLQKTVEARQIEALLSGEMDGNDTYIEVHAGAGGTESQDWAQMLARMYTRWAERSGFKVELQEMQYGEEAGIKSATILVKGEKAYGWLKTEAGVHRLVRISPYDSNARRHTSFSSVGVYPVIDDNIEIDIQDKDIRIDTYRSSGAGGQHVNTTDSAVRITHMPTGIVVTSSEKSQHQNRANAMKALRARLYELEMRKREEKRSPCMTPKRTLVGVTKSGLMFCNPINWSRICARAPKAQTHLRCWMVTLIALCQPPLHQKSKAATLRTLKIWLEINLACSRSCCQSRSATLRPVFKNGAGSCAVSLFRTS
jgi:peptide chain release factor 2